MHNIRATLAVLLALMASLLVVLSGFVAAYGETQPARAATVWPQHPLVQLRIGLEEIGIASARGQPATLDQIYRMQRASLLAPLRPEPFLVRGVAAELAGDQDIAGRAFGAAIRRSPRSIPAHYFMAYHHLRAGNSAAGLAEITTLTRLVPSRQDDVVTMLGTYAKSPGAAPQVKAMLRNHPELEPVMLSKLAADPANAELVLYLSNGDAAGRSQVTQWQTTLVASMVAGGQFERAHRLWRRLAKVDAAQSLLFNPKFADTTSPAPFNWTLASAATGLAEPQNDGLHLLYYGRENMLFASQMLRLDPGRYTLSFRMSVTEGEPAAIAWTLICLPGKQSIMTVNFGQVAKANGTANRFVVPAGCQAQQLELKGTAPEIPETLDVSLTGLAVTREQAQ